MKKNIPSPAQNLKKIKDMVIKEQTRLSQEIADKILTLATSAFGLVAALAWNEAIKAIFDQFFGSERDQLTAKISYAIIITILVVIITYYLSRFMKKSKNKIN